MEPLELELSTLKVRVEQLEKVVNSLAGTRPKHPAQDVSQTLAREQLITWLKDQGLIREPTVEEQRLASEWDVLPEEEQQAHIRLMRSLALDPTLSEIVAQNRR